MPERREEKRREGKGRKKERREISFKKRGRGMLCDDCSAVLVPPHEVTSLKLRRCLEIGHALDPD